MKKTLFLLVAVLIPGQSLAFDPTFGLFGGDDSNEPVRKKPMLNSQGAAPLPPGFSRPNVAPESYPSAAPTASVFIGSSPASDFSAPVQPGLTLPTSSPVNVSAAEHSAAGLPQLRRPPSFNQKVLGVPASAPAPAVTSAPIAPPKALIQAEAPAKPSLPTAMPKPEASSDYPKLANVPPAPRAPILPEADPRVQVLKAELEAQKAGIAPQPALKVLPRQSKPSGATTSLSSLRPIASTPIQKLGATPSAVAGVATTDASMLRRPTAFAQETPALQSAYSQPFSAMNITRVENLRPISPRARKKRNPFKELDGLTGVGTSYKKLDQRRHSVFDQ